MRKLDHLQFENSYVRLPETFGSRLNPSPLPDPYLVHFNPDAAYLIDLDPSEVQRREFVDYFSGNRALPGSDPLAMLYSGHQFGVYVPQLGDGRAILLGEVRNRKGERWDLQLKGSGQTPFSRHGDGRAVLRSTVREYLCSEAMYGLGVPTTRALCIVGSDQKVYRETAETSAVLLRLAPSHIRFGSFEVFYYRDQIDELRILTEYAVGNYFPELSGQKERFTRFFEAVVDRTARLIAHWQAVGFSHGVMNTDNMSILGLTFDYGPFGFMDRYVPGVISNHSDVEGRYAFHRQPYIGFWNLTRFGKALSPLVSVEGAQEILETYENRFNRYYLERMIKKLGLTEIRSGDGRLVLELLGRLEEDGVDYTCFFRALGKFRPNVRGENAVLKRMFQDEDRFETWADQYRKRLAEENSRDEDRQGRMDGVNPKYVLRNYMAHTAIRKAADHRDYSEIDRLLYLLKNPYSEQDEMEEYSGPSPGWARHIQISCSS